MRLARLLDIFAEFLLAQVAQLARPEHAVVEASLHEWLVLRSVANILPRMVDSQDSQVILEGVTDEIFSMEDFGYFAPAFIKGDGAIPW